MTTDPMLFADNELPTRERSAEKNFQSLRHPVWTEGKARLIQEYLRLFTFITRHGAYIDGFAAPQERKRLDMCSANLVLQNQPPWINKFWLCDTDPYGIEILEGVAETFRNRKRRIEVIPGDFNISVEQVLSSGQIKAKTATFALLDQRTFECAWESVQRLAQFKQQLDPETTKIEIFYFLASGWLDRSIAAVKRPTTAAKLDRWWGRDDWRSLQGMPGLERANLFAQRFKDELGYKYVYPYAIHDRSRNARTMYHMIHATDHPEASPLMLRAYRKISGRSDIDPVAAQTHMDALWLQLQDDSAP
jgi:three-Cys-motif partner protein